MDSPPLDPVLRPQPDSRGLGPFSFARRLGQKEAGRGGLRGDSGIPSSAWVAAEEGRHRLLRRSLQQGARETITTSDLSELPGPSF